MTQILDPISDEVPARSNSARALRQLAERTLRPFDEARPLAREFYTDLAIFEREQEQLFASAWFCCGPSARLREPGSISTVEAAEERLLLTCDENGVRHAFFNVCRHRGSCLVDAAEERRRRRVRCPYHAWTYRLDGSLEHAPHMSEHPGFDPDGVELRRCALAEWQGFLFVTLQESPLPLERQLSDAPDLSSYRTNELVQVEQKRYDVKANWKLLCENYSECYHCALAHPQLNRISHLGSGGSQQSGASFVGGPMRLNPGFNTMSHSGRSDRPSITPGLDDDDLVFYYVIYPNLFVSLHRDYVLTHTLFPRSPTRTEVVCDWLLHPHQVERSSFDASDAVDFWDLTNRQDWELCERTQRGAASRGFLPLHYQPSETCVHDFDRWYLSALLSDRVDDG